MVIIIITSLIKVCIFHINYDFDGDYNDYGHLRDLWFNSMTNFVHKIKIGDIRRLMPMSDNTPNKNKLQVYLVSYSNKTNIIQWKHSCNNYTVQ